METAILIFCSLATAQSRYCLNANLFNLRNLWILFLADTIFRSLFQIADNPPLTAEHHSGEI